MWIRETKIEIESFCKKSPNNHIYIFWFKRKLEDNILIHAKTLPDLKTIISKFFFFSTKPSQQDPGKCISSGWACANRLPSQSTCLRVRLPSRSTCLRVRQPSRSTCLWVKVPAGPSLRICWKAAASTSILWTAVRGTLAEGILWTSCRDVYVLKKNNSNYFISVFFYIFFSWDQPPSCKIQFIKKTVCLLSYFSITHIHIWFTFSPFFLLIIFIC